MPSSVPDNSSPAASSDSITLGRETCPSPNAAAETRRFPPVLIRAPLAVMLAVILDSCPCGDLLAPVDAGPVSATTLASC